MSDSRPRIACSAAVCLVLCGLFAGCRPALPQPPSAPADPADYVEVATSPRPAPVEIIPPRPRADAVWVDGSWEYSGSAFGWRYGTWAVVPRGVRRARWAIVRRSEDGQLFFAPSSWRDADGHKVDDSAWIHALGRGAQARTRIDEEAAPTAEEQAPPPPRPYNRGEREGQQKAPQEVAPGAPEVR